VIKFCGDAILCVFEPDRNSTPADSALAAVLCAMELKAKLRNFKAAEGVMLDLKLMIGHGEIVGNYVGDSALNHFEFLVTGQPMDQMTQAEHYVVPGDIIMSKEAHAIVEDSVVVKDVNPQAAAFGFKLLVGTTPSFVPPVAPPPSIPVRLSANRQRLLEMFNESTIVEKLDGIAGSWTRLERSSSSLRSRVSRHDLCTILFINMSSDKISSESNEEVLEGLNEAFMAFYHPTKLFQGTLRQFLLDDKGMVAIIVFSGRESNTISACRCSLKLQGRHRSPPLCTYHTPKTPPPPPPPPPPLPLPSLTPTRRRTSRRTVSRPTSASPPARCSSAPWATSAGARWRGSATP
jgi:hypothetical protein